ncbi:MAG: hypothetical protein KJO07_09145 [Deltaproteobacteria bacterium]|nr:hypothetical protein [Deltaproteobacteria bacterium]
MLRRLLGNPGASAVRKCLEQRAPGGPVAVVGDPALASTLANAGLAIISLDHRRRRLRRAPNAVLTEIGSVPLTGIAALVAAHPGDAVHIERMTHAVATGGLVVLLGGEPRVSANLALAGGLKDVEQAGGLTIGKILRFAS